ncbi:hypothetical protein DY037_05590 [Apilactobacillus micheneri]|uniref:hypothetical protein n=1 Tax=Apilactobacillus micheneri TaxID=1899430 RepID=UPI001128CF32|nr:hypothetical protein [Apilactobacillus micheneri]TPR49254.1 hypothetical protein DY037_05590 [Apilactobacillus micheneri]
MINTKLSKEQINNQIDDIYDFIDENDAIAAFEDMRDTLDELIITDNELGEFNKEDYKDGNLNETQYMQSIKELEKDDCTYYDNSKEIANNRICSMPADIETLSKVEQIYQKYIKKFPNAEYKVNLLTI